MKIKLIEFEGFKAPTRAHYNDAGADVYAKKRIILFGNSTEKIPLGFGVEIPDGFMGLVLPRSGLSSKGIFTQAAPIDSGYRGEIHAITTNTTSSKYIVEVGDRIGQLVIIPVVLADFTSEDLENRGNQGFASTGK
jgi:dUTP pyrophosphatase